MDLGLSEGKEFALFVFFAQNENKVIELKHLYEKVWGMPLNNDRASIRSAIRRLRNKLNGSGYAIEASYGNGYSFIKI